MIILIKGIVKLKLPAISKAFALIGLLVCCSIYASGQSCHCPPIDTCAPCSGGLTSLTLKFTGPVASTITASDNSGVIFSGVVSPGGTFTFTGTNPNEKFVGATVVMRINGSQNLPNIPTNCGGASFVGQTFGAFTIMAGLSKNGGSLCCSDATMEDIEPFISNCPTNVNKDLLSGCSMPVTWTIPTASDNCSVDTLFSVPAHGSVFELGPTLVVYTARDPFGNSTTCSFIVTVSDKIKPKFSNLPGPITVSANGSCEAVVEWTEPTATDNCSVEMSSDYNPGEIFQIGPTTVTYTAVDPSGNKETYKFVVTVVDTLSPVIKNCPADIVVFVDDECEIAVPWVAPTATDNCDFAMTRSHVPGSKFPLGDTTVVYTAKDPSGNITTCSFKVSVKTTQPPEMTGCPSDISAEADGTGVAIVTWDEPQATALCGDVTVTKSHEPGSPFPPGPNIVTYTFADESGNTSTCSFNVVVEPLEISFTVSQVVTPDGNGTNDFWELLNIERFPDNIVTVVDRWGNTVYKASGYDNKTVFWDGTSLNGGKVPTGTYFYTVEVRSLEETVHMKGFLEVIQ